MNHSYNKRIIKRFRITDSKIITPLFFILLFFTSCFSRNPDAENDISVFNSTKDTLFFTEKYRSSYRTYLMLQPNECRLLGGNYTITSLDIIREHYQKLDIEIEVYKLACSTCDGIKILERTAYQDSFYIEKLPRILWVPPLRSLPDSIHSFYNINSWVLTKGGRKNKWDRAVFTIKEDDLKQN